jgi:hypothetical protein
VFFAFHWYDVLPILIVGALVAIFLVLRRSFGRSL